MRVAVVGVCGSGKSTTVARLRALGIDAYGVAQEHSAVSDLWNHAAPDVVVLLETSLESVRQRRGADWPAWIYGLQRERLANARAHSTMVIDTDRLTPDETVTRIVARLRQFMIPSETVPGAEAH